MDYESNPYESAMRNQAVAIDSFFRVQSHSQERNTLVDKICFLRFPLYMLASLFFARFFFLEARIFVLVLPFL